MVHKEPFKGINKVKKDKAAFSKFLKEDLTEDKKIRKVDDDSASEDRLNSDGEEKIDYLRDLKNKKGFVAKPKDDFIFLEKDINWLMEKLIPPFGKKRPEINIPETVVFENGKPKFFIKNDQDGKVV